MISKIYKTKLVQKTLLLCGLCATIGVQTKIALAQSEEHNKQMPIRLTLSDDWCQVPAEETASDLTFYANGRRYILPMRQIASFHLKGSDKTIKSAEMGVVRVDVPTDLTAEYVLDRTLDLYTHSISLITLINIWLPSSQQIQEIQVPSKWIGHDLQGWLMEIVGTETTVRKLLLIPIREHVILLGATFELETDVKPDEARQKWNEIVKEIRQRIE